MAEGMRMQVESEMAERAEAVFGQLEQYGPPRVQRSARSLWHLRNTVTLSALPYFLHSHQPPEPDEHSHTSDSRNPDSDPSHQDSDEDDDDLASNISESMKQWRSQPKQTGETDSSATNALRQMALEEGYDPTSGTHASIEFSTGLERELDEDEHDVFAAGAGPSSQRTIVATPRSACSRTNHPAPAASAAFIKDGDIEHCLERMQRNLQSNPQHRSDAAHYENPPNKVEKDERRVL
jgi:hypothetical protein